MIEVKRVRELVGDHRFEHPGRHLAKDSVESDDPRLETVAPPLGGLIGDESDLGHFGGVGEAGRDLARDRLGSTIGVQNIRTRPTYELSGQLENCLVEIPNRDPVRGAHRKCPPVESRIDVLDPLSHHLELEGDTVNFEGSSSIRHGQHAT